jgi:hypothetical protein
LGIFPRSEIFLFISLFLLDIVKNTRPMRKVKGNELEAYLFRFKMMGSCRSNASLKSGIYVTENLEKGNLGKINENKFSAHQTSRIGPKTIK